jgi:hypothetical protein
VPVTAGVNIIERPNSRKWSFGMPGQEQSVTCVYLVQWQGATYPGDPAVLVSSNVPQVRQRPPLDLHQTDPYLKLMVARSVEWTPLREQAYAWEVVVRYSTFSLQTGAVFARVTRTPGSRQAALYRRNPFVAGNPPVDGDVAFPPTTACAGTRCDQNGVPEKYSVTQQNIQLEVHVDRTGVTGTGGYTAESITRYFIDLYAETRNSAAVLGFNRGELLYKGCSIAPRDEFYVITHTWIADWWTFLEQRPVMGPNGQPLLVSTASFLGTSVRQTDKVYWFQPYPDFSNHADILTFHGISGEITTPMPARLP